MVKKQTASNLIFFFFCIQKTTTTIKKMPLPLLGDFLLIVYIFKFRMQKNNYFHGQYYNEKMCFFIWKATIACQLTGKLKTGLWPNLTVSSNLITARQVTNSPLPHYWRRCDSGGRVWGPLNKGYPSMILVSVLRQQSLCLNKRMNEQINKMS